MSKIGKWPARCIATAAAVLWYAVIFGFSGQDGETSGNLSGAVARFLAGLFGGSPDGKLRQVLETVIRKGAHMTEFAVLAVLIYWVIREWTELRRGAYPLAFFVTVIGAAMDEFHQTFVSGRAGQARDVLIDSCGALIGLAILALIVRQKNVRCKLSENATEQGK